MNVVSHSALVAFYQRHPQARTPMEAWHAILRKATYVGPADIKAAFGTNVDFVADNRVIFDVGGNKFRIVVRFSYQRKACFIKFVGTHKEYDAIDPINVSL